MKKFLLLLIVLSLCLTGCSRKKSGITTYSHQDLTIQLPAGFVDLSDQDFARELDFAYGLNPIAVNGIREEKAAFQSYGLELDLQSYGQLVLASNNISSPLTQKEDILMFTYQSGDFTYVVTLWETESAFWTVQAYCQRETYTQVSNDIWEIFSSVTV